MRAVLTVIGRDRVGIIAGVSKTLSELDINIIDVSQTIMQEYFTMMMMLEVNEKNNYETIRKTLELTGNDLGVTIHIQNEKIFDAMHKL